MKITSVECYKGAFITVKVNTDDVYLSRFCACAFLSDVCSRQTSQACTVASYIEELRTEKEGFEPSRRY